SAWTNAPSAPTTRRKTTMLPNPAEAPAGRYTACDALLGALHESGVTHIFGNLGSDHAGIVQSLARAKLEGRPMPQVILSPHEGMALAAAHGYAQVTGQAQAVFVHVDVGTQNMGGRQRHAFVGAEYHLGHGTAFK